jgi:hypothetical protein
MVFEWVDLVLDWLGIRMLSYGIFCRTIKDWNKLPEHITNSTSTEMLRERLTHDVPLKTFPHLIQ